MKIKSFATAAFRGKHALFGRGLHEHSYDVTVSWPCESVREPPDALRVQASLYAELDIISGSHLHTELGDGATNEGIAMRLLLRLKRHGVDLVTVKMRGVDIGAEVSL